MSCSNQPLRHGLGISMVLVLYVNTKLKLIAILQGEKSLCFLFNSYQIGSLVTLMGSTIKSHSNVRMSPEEKAGVL